MKSYRHLLNVFTASLLAQTFMPWAGAQEPNSPASPSAAEQKTAEAASEENGAKEGLSPAEQNILIVNKSENLPEKQKKIRDAISVMWFKPESIQEGATNKDIYRLTFAGKTKPRTRIYMLSNEITTLKNNEKVKISLKPSQTKYLPGIADPRGAFLFELTLPKGNYEIPAAFVDPDAQSVSAAKTYILVLNVTAKGVEFGFREIGEGDSYSAESNFYSGGLGLNYFVYNKSSPDVPSEIRFSSFKIPSMRFGYSRGFGKEWRWSSYLMFAPGETQNGSRVPVDGGSYLWTSFSSDGIFSKEGWRKDVGRYRLRYGVRGGVQYHMAPFLVSKSADSNTQSVNNINLGFMAIGGHLDVMTDDDFIYELFLRIGVPGFMTSSISASDVMSFDGSIGARYRKKKSKWGYGLYWFGHWMKFNFAENDAFAAKQVSGSSDLLYSNIEFRLMYYY